MTSIERLAAIDQALVSLPAGSPAAAAVLVELAMPALGLDEDVVAAASRRGLLLAAAAGDPRDAVGPGSRAVLETAADLAAADLGPSLGQELHALARTAGEAGLDRVAAAALDLAEDGAGALEALALVVLAHGGAND